MYLLASARENATKARARKDDLGKKLTPEQISQAQLIAETTLREAARRSESRGPP
jgi:hypothetical protein